MVIGLGIAGLAMTHAQDSAAPRPRDYYPTQRWRNASPASQGMDASFGPLMTDTVRQRMTYLRGIMVVRHGYIIFEDYFGSWDKHDLYSTRSVTKSITCAVVGIALARGDLPSLDVTFAQYFPEYFQERQNIYKSEITLRDLLMMRSGLAWDETKRQNILNLARSTDDQLGYIINLGINYPHGQTYLYSTADVHLISGIISRATGQSLAAYAQTHLFAPLGIDHYEWISDQRGYSVGGTELALSLSDMAKFGQLYLNMGTWEGQQIVPADWIAWTTQPQPDLTRYGYLWWINQPHYFDEAGYFALGYGGQYIIVFPALDMVIVTATDYNEFGSGVAHDHAAAIRQVVNEIILPSVAIR
jgi:CubicO group peptidase (beta-lactamase class C family)